MLFPKAQAELIDTWQVGGLRGTGSHTFAVDDLFVPEHRTASLHDDPVREPGALYRFSQISVFSNGFGSVALGVARAAVDALVELAGGKRPRGDPRLLREKEVVQTQVGQAEAHRRAGLALVHETVERAWDEVGRTGRFTTEQRIAMRLSGTHAIHSAARAVDLMYEAASASAIYTAHPLHRRFQDVHTITQHVQGRLEHYQTVGKQLLGLEPDPQWL
jgi:alkylation response protein AidB-like acyl-CoA dehydrogenase